MSRRIIGIDPGSISGAWALLAPEGVVVGDVPVLGKNVNAPEFARILRALSVDFAVVEDVHSFPGQGVASSFSFGRGLGTILGVVGALEIPMISVSPTKWKKHFGIVGKRDDKDAGRIKAISLFPSAKGLELKKHAGRSDALLLARWFVETETGEKCPS